MDLIKYGWCKSKAPLLNDLSQGRLTAPMTMATFLVKLIITGILGILCFGQLCQIPFRQVILTLDNKST